MWLILIGCQVPTGATPSHPLLNWTGDRKCNESLLGLDKGTGQNHPVSTITGKRELTWKN